jgi:hypothetical protein
VNRSTALKILDCHGNLQSKTNKAKHDALHYSEMEEFIIGGISKIGS